ncbi:upstream stimulatory factor 2 isoform X2 [Patagioenas fasciata]|uniref:upstream stimulatory factor 2 isoform X2 n=1 Tax=Patagioenas fasciata TaxID=372321 RepID=UPI0032E8EF67
MDMLDPGLDSASGSAAPSHEKNQEPEESVDLQEGEGPSGEDVPVAIASVPVPVPGTFADSGLQYQFRSESNGSQVTEAPLDGPEGAAVSVVSTFAGTTQAVIQNPFSNGGSPGAEGGTETRFAWGGDGTVSVQTDPALAQAGGQFYVMMTPQDVLQPGTQRSIAPRGHPYSPKLEGPRVPRDERRRAQHNEVERRRRDKINNWIVQLSKIIPDCGADNSKTGASKGGILSKACDYVRELRQSNQRLQETFKEAERLQMDNELLRRQMEELKSENALLRQQLQSRGDGTENNPGQGQ